MPQGKPQSGEKYRHFKDKLYQIVAVARHSETGEELVIYQALYGTFGVYARPLSMFVSEVDHGKYPNVTQKYRFQLVEPSGAGESEQEAGTPAGEPEQAAGTPAGKPEQAAGTPAGKPERAGAARKEITELLMDFYDARTYEQKYDILINMREDITDVMIDNMAVVLDIVIPEGELDDRFEELKSCLRTCRKYENSRF